MKCLDVVKEDIQEEGAREDGVLTDVYEQSAEGKRRKKMYKCQHHAW